MVASISKAFQVRGEAGATTQAHAAARPRGPWLADWSPDHGVARSARTAMGAAGSVGASRGAVADIPRTAGTLRRELDEAAIVTRSDRGYTLTPAGADLLGRLLSLDEWASRWASSRTAAARPV